MTGKPAVLFPCVHNAGRSQMALGWFQQLAGDRAVAWGRPIRDAIEGRVRTLLTQLGVPAAE